MTALTQDRSSRHDPRRQVSVPTTSSVGDARAIMDETGTTVLVVLDGGDPVGVVTASDLEGTPKRRPHATARIDDVMTTELVVIDPRDGVLETLNKYTAQAWSSLRRRGPRGDEEMRRRAAAFTADG